MNGNEMETTMIYPSIKTLRTIAGERAAELRAILDRTIKMPAWSDSDEWDYIEPRYPATAAWVQSCHKMPTKHEIRMSIADEILGTCGVEFIPHGHNAKSSSIEYCNAGDPYTLTLLFVRGNYRVGCWGDIVERGHYD
jgi:hypothetical protein